MENKNTTYEELKNSLSAYEAEYKKHPDFKKKIGIATRLINTYKAKSEEPLKNMQAALTVCMNSIKEYEQIYNELFSLLDILDMKDLKLVDKTADAYLRVFKKMISDSLKELNNACNS